MIDANPGVQAPTMTVTKTKTHMSAIIMAGTLLITSTLLLGLFSSLAAVNLIGLGNPPVPGPVSYWNFDNMTTVVIPDVEGDNDGFLLGVTTSQTTDEDAIKGDAMDFDGTFFGRVVDNSGAATDPKSNTNSGVEEFSLDIIGDITISAWVKRESGSGYAGILTKWAFANEGRSYELVVDQNNRFRMVASNNGLDSGVTFVSSNGPVINGQWYHVVGVLNGSNLKIYVNRELQNDQKTHSGGIYSSNSNVIFGAFNTGDDYRFNGLMDEVRVFDRALSEAEIDQLYVHDAADRLDLLVGSLDASVSGQPAPSDVVQGDTDVVFTNLVLDASQSDKALLITQLKLKVTKNNPIYPTFDRNIKLYNDLGVEIPGSFEWSDDFRTFNFSPGGFIVDARTVQTITVKADIGKFDLVFGWDDALALGLDQGAITVQDGGGNSITPTIISSDGPMMSLMPVEISNIEISDVTQDSAVINYHVSGRINSESSVRYGTTPDYFDWDQSTPASISNQTDIGFDGQVELSGLTADKTYYFVIYIDEGTPYDFVYLNDDLTFLTLSSAGSLIVSISDQPEAQDVVVGTQDFTFTNLIFDATNVTQNVDVTKVGLKLSTQGMAYPDLITDIRLFDGDTEIIPNNYPGDLEYEVSGTTPGTAATSTYTFDIGEFGIPAGTSKTIRVEADIGSGPTIAGDDDTLAIGLFPTSVESEDDGSNPILVGVIQSYGPRHILQSGAEVTVAASNPPPSALVVGGDNVKVGRFKMRADGEPVDVDSITLHILPPENASTTTSHDEVNSLSVRQGATVLGSASVHSEYITISFLSPVTLPDGGDVFFDLYAQFEHISPVTSATSGGGLRFEITDFEVSGTTGLNIDVSGLPVQFNSFFVFKSIPTMYSLLNYAVISSSTPIDIYKFGVWADWAGPIGLYELSFGVSTVGVQLDLSSFELANATTTIARAEDMTFNYGGSPAYPLFVTVHFDPDDNTVGIADEVYTILNGDNIPLTLRATLLSGHDDTPGNESITTQMGGDHYLDVNSNAQYLSWVHKFVWTDLSYQNLFASGYLVPGLPYPSTTAQIITD